VADVDALASRIDGARKAEFAGDAHAFFSEPEPDMVAAQIQEFVTGRSPRSAATGPWRRYRLQASP